MFGSVCQGGGWGEALRDTVKLCFPPFLCFHWYQLNTGLLDTSAGQGIGTCVLGRWSLGSWFCLDPPFRTRGLAGGTDWFLG